MPKYKIQFNKVILEPFEEVIVEANSDIDARLTARGLATEKQKGMEGQITAVVTPVEEGEPEGTNNGVSGVPF